jgi:hypothetical protein
MPWRSSAVKSGVDDLLRMKKDRLNKKNPRCKQTGYFGRF